MKYKKLRETNLFNRRTVPSNVSWIMRGLILILIPVNPNFMSVSQPIEWVVNHNNLAEIDHLLLFEECLKLIHHIADGVPRVKPLCFSYVGV